MANDAEVSQYVNERNANQGWSHRPWPYTDVERDEDRPTYAWTVDGRIRSGTLVDYAEDLRQAHYNDANMPPILWLGGQSLIRPSVKTGPWGEDDYATVTVTAPLVEYPYGDDVATFRIDGRA